MKLSILCTIKIVYLSLYLVLPSYGQVTQRKIIINGELSEILNNQNKCAIVVDGDTIVSIIGHRGSFRASILTDTDLAKPCLATLIYPFDRTIDSSKKKIIQLFFLDADTINILIDSKHGTIETYGGYENMVNSAYLRLDKQYFDAVQAKHTDKNASLDSLSMRYYKQLIDTAARYKNSLSSYNRLFSLFRPTAFPLRDSIYNVIQALDRNIFTEEDLQVISSTYMKFVQKNIDKGNDTLWPELQYETFESIDFSKLSLSYDYVLIDIWATWCGPCIEQHPHIKKLAVKYAAKSRFKIVGLAIQCKKEDWAKHLTSHPTNYLNYWLDKKNTEKLVNQIKITEIPRYVLLRTADNTLVEKRIPFDKIEAILEKYNIK
ncbi:TlpA family protein disulfide reductase [Sphingobacterium faecale]|uniref:Thioredoxin family protein n=1 Tax=Sphingobacterium faecale TaxID=2803775 RepID=A0ABS1R058_9SPHI|nr:thioredoxin family protein [Sphingobacterium faecale]MBL1408050.1 thioredoxin family protein [Sphingobacterium faecale]